MSPVRREIGELMSLAGPIVGAQLAFMGMGVADVSGVMADAAVADVDVTDDVMDVSLEVEVETFGGEVPSESAARADPEAAKARLKALREMNAGLEAKLQELEGKISAEKGRSDVG